MTDDERRMLKSWRGRRYLICRAISTIDAIIENLGVEENSDPIPDNFTSQVDDKLKAELGNMAANLLRLTLLLNDGNISSQRLPRF